MTNTVYYPNYICSHPNCVLSNAQLLAFGAAQEYPGLDFAIPHFELVFRGNFDN